MTGLGDLRTPAPAPSFVVSEAYGISPDGYFIVGGARNDDDEDEPFIWDSSSGMRGLGTALPDRFHAAADISADGSIIVGPPAGFTATAFIWDQVHGIRKLHEFLTNELGLDLTGWTLYSAAAISDDGRKIVGNGTNPLGQTEAWLAVIGDGSATPTPTPAPSADCLCEVKSINPNQVILQNVGTGGKGASATRKMVMDLNTVDAPGATCDPGEFSYPIPVNLKMEDDRGNILIDSSKIVVCGQGVTKNLKRDVFFRGPLNCENGAVPPPKPDFSLGTITVTGSAPGTADYVEDIKIKCFE
jgi:hypothetical protein